MEKPKECFKTSVGGQALMEGIMMRGPEKICVAVRRPDGTLDMTYEDVKHHRWQKIPLVRGAAAMIENLVLGYRYLMHSAEVSMPEEAEEEPGRFEKWLGEHAGPGVQNFFMALAAVCGGLLAIVLFMVLPTAIVGLIDRFLPLGWGKVVLEGVLKIALFVGYLFLCTRMKEIHRVFEYHGAEHKTIACYEAGEELTVENVRHHRRFHPRCGTSFMILVLIVSILLFSVLPWSSTGLRVVLKLLLLPVVMGVSYELIKLAGRYDNLFTRIISAPGLWLQRLTTFEPDDSMIEVAIAAVTPVLPDHPDEAKW
ncbi:MAG: DUF1385 domain-containing protein [Oscillospiraceae bacterium]|uniref:DUF1385 domain-containing protein n=1 Tax=Allofournierella TaxID=1940255 RepID=UPI002E78060F|nr:DUF1385 domain-containing protein [Fournierella sp.]MCI6959122.1 DUF1385 domain-containing protein [Oscillospiraceae bacterium]MEE0756854.1 DUF1385 domain-containing protein [Fournierella sp.]